MRSRISLLFLALVACWIGLAGCGAGSGRSGDSLNSTRAETPSAPADEEPTRAPTARAGMQLLLLPFWSASSRNNFLSVFSDGKGGYTAGPQKLAISFAPYLYGPSTNYVNARYILDKLVTAGKDISVTVFLDRGDYHRGGTGADADIQTSAKDFNDNFLKSYAGKVALSVCPSLEDHASKTDIIRWATQITSKIDSSYRSYVAFRRNPDAGYGSDLPAQGSYRAVQLELHGPVNSGTLAGAAYSNDGVFVGKSTETMTTSSVSGQSPTYSVSQFASALRSNGYTGTALFWRPAYNLFKRVSKNGKIDFDRTQRDLSDAQTSFDATEVQILKDFLNS